jgi:hypothetical protein
VTLDVASLFLDVGILFLDVVGMEINIVGGGFRCYRKFYPFW